MILVTGATGTCGRRIVDELVGRGVPVRAMSRNPESAEWFGREGVDAVRADFAAPRELEAVMDGVDGVFLLSSQHPDQAVLQGNVVNAALAAGVRRVVKLSAGEGIVGMRSPSFVGRLHWQTERQIADAGLDYTFIRPSYFLQNLLLGAPAIQQGTLPLPFGDARIAMIDVRDIAAVAATVLADGDAHNGQVYVLTGPEALTPAEIAERFGNALAHEVRHVDPTVDGFIESLRARGAPPYQQRHMREVVTLFKEGAGEKVTDTVRDVTGRAARTVDTFVRDHANAFR